MAVPKVAAIHDLSGLGRCSLTAAIPILAAMGVQACPLPTAVLSNQTGFPSYACADMTAHLAAFTREWKKRNAHFDGIYTGFLCNVQQAELAAAFIDNFSEPETLVLVDPVLGDNGHLYPVFDEANCRAMAALAAKATVLTPNLTEACLLTGGDYAAASAAQSLEPIWSMAAQLARLGPETIVITGVHRGDTILNLGFCARDGSRFSVGTRRMGPGYSGTGDILASVLCGGLVGGQPLLQTLKQATALLEAAIAETCRDGTDPNEGVAFEPHLALLQKG